MKFTAWTSKDVEDRIIEAAETLMLCPRDTGPKAFGSAMPEPVRSRDEYGYGSAWYKRRPSGAALSRMTEVWGWINAHPVESERQLLYSWAAVKARKGRTVADFALERGMKSRTLRWAISAICQRIANDLNQKYSIWLTERIDPVAETEAETASSTVASKRHANHFRAFEELPGDPVDRKALIKRIEKQNRLRQHQKRSKTG